MTWKWNPTLPMMAILIALAAGCGKEPERILNGEAGNPQNDPAGRNAQLPPGHPPLDPDSIVPPAPGSGTAGTGMLWEPPAGWIAETPSSAMRRAQYRVPGPGGDGECAVFYFGPGQGGDPRSNAERWAAQFEQPDGSDPIAAMKTSKFQVGGKMVLLVETAGTYLSGGPMAGGATERKPGYMLLGAVVEGPDANWFFKLTGPQATVEPQRAAFDAMIRSIRQGA